MSSRDPCRRLLWRDARTIGPFGLPQLLPERAVPHDVISWSERRAARPERHWVDFFIDDSRFEGLWRDPWRCLPLLRRFAGVIGPDFSMAPEMLPAQAVWNCARNRVLAYWMQREGVRVIPAASWRGPEDFAWCFDGLPEGGAIAVSTNGCLSTAHGRTAFLRGAAELFARKSPKPLVVCGRQLPGRRRLHARHGLHGR